MTIDLGAGGDLMVDAERVSRGVGVSKGLGIGPAYVIEGGTVQVPEYRIAPDHIEAELARFDDAAAEARRQITALKAKATTLPDAASEEVGFLLDAHLAMLERSRLMRGVARRIAEDRSNAEAAVDAEVGAITRSFSASRDRYLATRAADVREVGTRLVRNLMGCEPTALAMLPPGAVLVAEELSPAQTALLDPARVAGLATVLGGAEGHTAIMARSMGVPAVIGVSGLLASVRSGDIVVVDADADRVLVNPSAATLGACRRRQDADRRATEQLQYLAELPAITADGVEVGMYANLEFGREVPAVRAANADGIGLLRTEFMFMNRATLPSEDEQYEALREIVTGMGGRPVTMRTLDVGGDKLAASLASRLGHPVNPALGLRAIRLGLREPRLLETQLAAMLRAARHGPIRILLPMISSIDQVRRVRRLLGIVARRLRRHRVAFTEPLPPLGVMIEVPGAALAADALARVSDFFSIGTNDLTQYTLAIDRCDEQVKALYDPLHPAVLRLVQFTVEAALRARLPVDVCGEVAGDPRFTALLLGLGVRELSMAPRALPIVKQRIRALRLADAVALTDAVMAEADPGRIKAMIDRADAEALERLGLSPQPIR